jgi:hypothetical protein
MREGENHDSPIHFRIHICLQYIGQQLVYTVPFLKGTALREYCLNKLTDKSVR